MRNVKISMCTCKYKIFITISRTILVNKAKQSKILRTFVLELKSVEAMVENRPLFLLQHAERQLFCFRERLITFVFKGLPVCTIEITSEFISNG